jgi:PAS domain S-box-containing protein
VTAGSDPQADGGDGLTRAIVEVALDCVIVMDEQGACREFNPAAERVFGHPRKAVIGRQLGEVIVPPHLRAAHAAGLARLLATGESRMVGRRIETVGLRSDGSTFPVELAIVAASAGGERLFVAYLRDLTERVRAAEALQASEARLAAFTQHAPLGMYLKDLDGRYVMLNPEMEKVLGRPAGEMLGKEPAAAFGPEEVAMIRAYDGQVVETGRPTRHEEHLPGLDAYEWSMVIRFPVKDAAGIITHVGGFDVDITAQKRAQALLEASEQRFRAVVEDQTELICRHSPDLRLTFSNAAHARIFGKRPEELLGQHMLEDASIPEHIRPLLRAELEALTPENPIVRGENEKVLPDGEVRWYEWLNRALFDADGRLTGYQSVGRDTTERRRAEEEIARQREALHQQEKLSALGSLLAGVAHELNNPLAVIIARAVMLEEDVREPALAVSVARLRTAAERCAKIVKTFLAMARQKPRERRPVQLEAVIEAGLDMLSYGLRADGVEVTRDMAPDLPAVSADEDQLHQVFLNLLVNAQQALREAPPPRRILVTATREAGLVRVDVADTGPGVPAALRARIFEPFFTTKPVGSGTGLGLSVCHGIITAYDGTIEAGLRPGGGALFTVRLPAAPEGATPAAPAPAADAGPPPARILVVDDEPEVLAAVEEVLGRDGHVVELASGGREALRLLEDRAFDLVISDLRMPEGDGRELHRELASRHPDLARRMLFFTGDTLGVAASELADVDRDALIEKPVEPAALRRAVRRRLDEARDLVLQPSLPGRLVRRRG